MDVHEVEAVDVVVAVEGAREAGGLILMRFDHPLVLGLGVPANVVAKIYPTHADAAKVGIVWIAVLPDVGFLESVEDREQVVGFTAHQIVVLAVATGHFHFVLVREHPDLFQPLVSTPNNQRNPVAHGGLDREYGLTGEARPVHAPELTQGSARDLLDRHRVDVLDQDVAIESDSKIGQVLNPQRRVEVLVVCDQERVQSQALLDDVNDEVGVMRPSDRNDAVVRLARPAAIGLDHRFEHSPAQVPVERVFLFVDTTA